MPNSNVQAQLCVLCGINAATTGQGDHIPPKSLYTKDERRNAKFQFHTVPACEKCNVGGSAHDEGLKLLVGLESGESRDNPLDVIDNLAGTIGKNQRLANQVFSSAQKVTLERESGIQIPAVQVKFDEQSYKLAIARIARAMYWRTTGDILPAGIRIEAVPLHRQDPKLVRELEKCAAAFPLTEVNGGTLKCKILEAENAELMVLQFFNKHTALALLYTNLTSRCS